MVENNLELIGSSAIEDKLQDQVPETISYLLEVNASLSFKASKNYFFR